LVEPIGSSDGPIAFFGGGADLTPYYLFDEDISLFHTMYRDLCETTQAQVEQPDDATLFAYPSLKKLCDDYFFLPARSEHRGTGGIFFDDLPASTSGVTEFVRNVADTWMPSWLPIIEKRRKMAYTDNQKQWQLLRRGRYLEFNLLYDRGVKFGLANANPRVEGVMVSAPPVIAFEYNHQIVPGSDEDRIMQVLRNPKNWV
jgi:coproporphyrinogen III oxidase